jgi:dolichol-phosphate mannosyltransferase
MNRQSTPTVSPATDRSAVGEGAVAVQRVQRALSVVVPCFNEEGGIESLVDRLLSLEQSLQSRGGLEVVFVDDGSTDATLQEITSFSSRLQSTRILRHGQNRGLAAAMMTGICEATSEFVGVLDADCTYDPAIMVAMLSRMNDEVAAVTASPYHKDGEVVAVPPWRLRISKFASTLYRFAFQQKLATYTSCCRIYRKSAVEKLELTSPGFVGVTELLWKVDRAGGTIVEFPARLSSRVVGHSKLKVMKTARQHLIFLSKAVTLRFCDALSGLAAPRKPR